jgi:hypothetical protein
VTSSILSEPWHGLRLVHPRSVLLIVLFASAFFFGIRVLEFQVSRSSEKVLPAGSIITVRVQRTLTSGSQRVGDEFEARVVSARTADGRHLPIEGAWARGRCVAVRAKENPARSGYLRLSLTDLHDRQGHVSALLTTAVSQWGNSGGTTNLEAPSLDRLQPPMQVGGSKAESRSPSAKEANITPETPIEFALLQPVAAAELSKGH